MTMQANGTFEVKLNVQKADNKEEESAKLGRMSSEKQFHGDLEGTSAGEMLSVGTEVKGSAGYVAMERVSGTLHGRTGTFALFANPAFWLSSGPAKCGSSPRAKVGIDLSVRHSAPGSPISSAHFCSLRQPSPGSAPSASTDFQPCEFCRSKSG